VATTIHEAQLEIDGDRGVIYVHCKKTGRTLLRICSLPKPIPDLGEMGCIDLTHMRGVDYAVPETKP
jgi:hypothetical protein